jgi:hypothetical protein
LSDVASSIAKAAQVLKTAEIDTKTAGFEMPRHVAIIMDGNGRWAAARGLPRVEGHRRGVEALRKTVRAAGELGIAVLTIFSFSSENWARPQSEIRDLLLLLRRFIRNDLVELHKSNVCVRIIGERDDLAADIRGLLQEAEDLTRNNTGLNLVVAFNYGSQRMRSRRICWDGISIFRTCPIPTSSSAPVASSGCPISCCGRPPIVNSFSSPPIGRTLTARRWKTRSPNIGVASAVLAD